MTDKPGSEIDAVITWVDGQEEKQSKKLAAYLASLGAERPIEAAPTRFNCSAELEYCVASLQAYAPWLRTIYLVTDDQRPTFLDSLQDQVLREKIQLVDHREIFAGYESYLPCFNSVAIESLLWRIPNLSEKFIYLNDDCFVLSEVEPNDFFRGEKIVLPAGWKIQEKERLLNKLPCLRYFRKTPKYNEHRHLQENSARLLGIKKHFLHLPHIPFPLKKSLFKDFFAEHPLLLANNIRYRLRNKNQFWPISLVYHKASQQQELLIDNRLKAVMVNAGFHSLEKIKQRLSKASRQKNVKFLCMQSLDLAGDKQDYMFSWLERHIGR